VQTQVDLKSFNIRPYRAKHLRDYCARMSKDNDHIVYDDNVADKLKAEGIEVPERPRSIYRVDKLYDALSKYAPRYAHGINQDEHVRHGIALAHICFGPRSVDSKLNCLPFTPETIREVTSSLSSSAGLTNFGFRKAESQTRALERGLQTLIGEKAPEPCIAYYRTQFNEKTRLVWGYPYSMTAIEGLVAKPLQRKFLTGFTPMAFGLLNGVLGARLRVASYHKKWAYSLDYSSFDSTISRDLIKIAFRILKRWFDLDVVEPESGKTVGEIFDVIETYFITTPIVMPDSQLYLGKRHGVPSGSYFTQMVDSIVNTIVIGSISSRFNMHVAKSDIFVLGDDALFWSNREVDLMQIASYVGKTFGLILGGYDKSYRFRYDESVKYLGRIWTKGIPTQELEEIVVRQVYPERFRRYSSDELIREREVKLLFISYATVYYDAAPIVWAIFGGDAWYSQSWQYVEYAVYADGEDVANVEHQSGLERFTQKYLDTSYDSYVTTVATSYWL